MLSNNTREEADNLMDYLRIIDCHVVDYVGGCFKSQVTDSKQKRVRHRDVIIGWSNQSNGTKQK